MFDKTAIFFILMIASPAILLTIGCAFDSIVGYFTDSK